MKDYSTQGLKNHAARAEAAGAPARAGCIAPASDVRSSCGAPQRARNNPHDHNTSPALDACRHPTPHIRKPSAQHPRLAISPMDQTAKRASRPFASSGLLSGQKGADRRGHKPR